MLFNIIFKQYLNIFIRNFVLCIQIRFVSTEKTTRIASRASCSVLQTMYKSLILPIIYYGLLLWGPHCERLFLLQKQIMRVITNSKYIAHTDPIFKTLNLLKLSDLYRLQLYKLYYKIKKQTVPIYFRHILTKVVNPYNTRNTFFKYPIARHEYTRKTCLYQVINYVNYSPNSPLMKLRTDMSDQGSLYLTLQIKISYGQLPFHTLKFCMNLSKLL